MSFSEDIMRLRYSWDNIDGSKETWEEISNRVVENVFSVTKKIQFDFSEIKEKTRKLISERKFIPGGRFLAQAGRDYHQTNNCFLLRVEDTREGWADVAQKATVMLMSGGGLGIDYSSLRPKNTPLKRSGGVSSGAIPLMKMINEIGRGVMAGGKRRSAIWAGLRWSHGDILEFIDIKNWSPEIKKLKEKDFDFPAPMDMTNISVILDKDFFDAFDDKDNPLHKIAHEVYWKSIENMVKYSEPGFSVDYESKNESLRNACTEIVSEDDSDVCCLGSINFSKIESIEELKEVTELGQLFLILGVIYSDVPHPKVKEIKDKNMRTGLGIMGFHEWLIRRGYQYEPNEELGEWLGAWKEVSDKSAKKWSKILGVNEPIKKRAIAPNGCQKPDTLIISSDGILELGEIGNVDVSGWQKINMSVSKEKIFTKATRFYNNGYKTTKILKLSSGAELESTLNHKYRVLDNNGKYIWKENKDIQVGDNLIVSLGTYNKESEPDLIGVDKSHWNEQDVIIPQKMNPDLAYLLGMIFSDGSIHKKGIRISTNGKTDEYLDVMKQIKKVFNSNITIEDNNRNCKYVCINSQRILKWLSANSLLKQKSKSIEFPKIIRQSSKKSIEAFLNGFFFGDGSYSNSSAYIDTASKKFATQFQIIIRALGKDSSIQEHLSGLGSKMYRVRWVETKRRCETKEITSQLINLGLDNCTVDTVISTKKSKSLTLDIEVPEENTYVSNSFISHNTISIAGGQTTSGIEPIFSIAYQRRYLTPDGWKKQYVVDFVAEKLHEEGFDLSKVEDAHSLSRRVEKRISFQAFVQGFVDNGISSTINLPAYGELGNNDYKKFGNLLYKYLPKLRGITCYADGSRGGQPLTPVDFNFAISKKNVVFEGNEECTDGICGL